MSRDKLLDEIHKWQASSVHHRFRSTPPEAVFTSQFLPVYDRYHNNIWHRILRLHGTIVSLETLSRFPFEHFYTPRNSEFWHYVIQNFMDTSVLLLCGLITDTGKHCLTLKRLRNILATESIWIHEKDRVDFRDAVKSTRFKSTHNTIACRVMAMRDSSIAHSLAVDISETDELKAEAGPSLDGIRILFDASHQLFGTLSFGSTYITLAGDYAPTTQLGQLSTSSLDEVLNAIVKTSFFVNEPELKPQWWREHRKHRSQENLDAMNRYRTQFGLPEA